MEEKSFLEIIDKIKNIKYNDSFNLIVGIRNGGIIPAGIIANYLKLPLEFIHLNLRDQNNLEIREKPILIGNINFEFKDKKILLVDDVSRTGKTFVKAKELLKDSKSIKTMVVNGTSDYSLFNEDCFKMPWNI
jgi:uncharacterized protein